MAANAEYAKIKLISYIIMCLQYIHNECNNVNLIWSILKKYVGKCNFSSFIESSILKRKYKEHGDNIHKPLVWYVVLQYSV